MLLVLSEHDKASLQFLTTLPTLLYPDLVRSALAVLLSTKQAKLTQQLTSAAAKLKVDVQQLSGALDVVTNCFINGAKKNLTSLVESLTAGGIDEKLAEVIQTTYQENWEILAETTRKSAVQVPEYKGLEWRLECEVGSRSLHDTITPNILTKWSISDPSTSSVHLNCDVLTLQHITESLRSAQLELETFHARKMIRNLNRIG